MRFLTDRILSIATVSAASLEGHHVSGAFIETKWRSVKGGARDNVLAEAEAHGVKKSTKNRGGRFDARSPGAEETEVRDKEKKLRWEINRTRTQIGIGIGVLAILRYFKHQPIRGGIFLTSTVLPKIHCFRVAAYAASERTL